MLVFWEREGGIFYLLRVCCILEGPGSGAQCPIKPREPFVGGIVSGSVAIA